MSAVFVFEAIGTRWQIEIKEALSSQEEALLLSKIRDRIERFEQTYSRFRENSFFRQLSRSAGTYQLPADAHALLMIYFDLYQRTNGAFTPLMGRLLEEAGYDPAYSLKTKELHRPPSLEEVLSYENPTLILKQPTIFDFGAAGKGYLIDLVGELLKGEGLQTFSIDAGGDILHRDPTGKALRIGLENPSDTQQAIGIAQVINESICGSAGNRRAWGNFHHIINPQTLTSPREILATWVVAEKTMVADAIATCLFFVDAKTLQEAYAFEYVTLFADFSVEKSAGFEGELFTGSSIE